MLRALGFNTRNVVSLIFLQAIIFAILGAGLGLIMAAILNIILRHVMFSFAQNYMSFHLSNSAIGIGMIIGLIVPLGANLFPMRNALSKNLRKSLDFNHRSASEMIITVTRLTDMGMSLS